MVLNVRFTPQALGDLCDIHSYISDTDKGAADRILSRIRQVTTMLESFPMLGRDGSVADTREFAIPGLPYTIVYRLSTPTDLDILSVVHQRKLYPPHRG
ncbi:type II toxin-antitoxin system RelE/ParE family toxin [Allorhizobium pseudoryzae]|uniref:type II toxin-antitoxin system RelE/ParE family toxin n=1 Tax=Allorhizobium pseudoryzae TaxID=379684 RepID=UPI003D045AD7